MFPSAPRGLAPPGNPRVAARARPDGGEAEEAEDRGRAERREHPPLDELDAGVAAELQHGEGVGEITEREQRADRQQRVERRARRAASYDARDERRGEEEDEARALGV